MAITLDDLERQMPGILGQPSAGLLRPLDGEHIRTDEKLIEQERLELRLLLQPVGVEVDEPAPRALVNRVDGEGWTGHVLPHPEAVGEAFNITGEPGRDSYWSHMLAWRDAGQRVPRLVIPVPFPSRREYSIDKARRVLGWAPKPLVESFRDLVAREAESIPPLHA